MAPILYRNTLGDNENDEERKRLISEETLDTEEPLEPKELYIERAQLISHRLKRIGVLVVLALVLTAGALGSLLCTMGLGSSKPHTCMMRSNGTHEFKRSVLIVSIDGLRADYLDRGLTPHLLDISKKGLRAKSMKPIFPTLTFPNHWALMTGLHAESHGIVGNNFWDPVSQSEFHYNKVESCWNASWWLGEPMWETVERAGIKTANLMWPGPPKTSGGVSSTYFIPWADHIPLRTKLDQLVKWIDLPLEERPQLLMMYEPSLDQAGHSHGPNSKQVNETLAYVDTFAKDLHTEIVARNLTDILDIIFVSDHGMTDISHPTNIYIDDIIGLQGVADIEHEDGWPAMGLRFKEGANVELYLQQLLEAAKANPDKFDVFTRETMLERYHFTNNIRIAPIYLVPKLGYVLTTHAQGNVGLTKGTHGYDNDYAAMHAMFVAHGPFSTTAKIAHQSRRDLSAWHSMEDNAYVMNTFQNVEIYGLVTKLLGLEDRAAPNNGTKGFWDIYLS